MGHYPDNWYVSSNDMYHIFEKIELLCRNHKMINGAGAKHLREMMDKYLEEYSIEVDEKNSQNSIEE